MRLQRWTNYLLDHRAIALAATFVVTLVPVIGIFSIVYAALVTLRKGWAEGLLFTLAATLPYFLSVYVTGHLDNIPLYIWAGIGMAVLSNILTWVFAVMVNRRTNWSKVLQLAALFGVLVVSAVHLAYPQVQEWWGAQLNTYYSQASDALKTSAISTESMDTQRQAINEIKYSATGMIVAAILLNAFLPLVAGAWWRAIVFNPGSLRRELHNIRLSSLAGVLFLISLVFSYLGNNVVLDIMPVLYLLFLVAGLSLIHYLFGLMMTPVVWFWLSLMYVVLFFAMPMSFIAVAMLALFDIWFDIRKKVRTS